MHVGSPLVIGPLGDGEIILGLRTWPNKRTGSVAGGRGMAPTVAGAPLWWELTAMECLDTKEVMSQMSQENAQLQV